MSNMEEITDGFIVVDGVLEPSLIATAPEHSPSKYSEILPGTTVIFKDEGSLFPGKVISSSQPHHVVAVMTKSLEGGWRWPQKRDILKIKFDDIVSFPIADKIKIISSGVYTVEDDLLYMEWGE